MKKSAILTLLEQIIDTYNARGFKVQIELTLWMTSYQS